MLDPHDRQIYIEALKPPLGYEFDYAAAAVYSLNLLTLLSVPLSFSRFELKEKDDLIHDPVMVLEALRRSADRFAVFCQKGGIHVPAADYPLFRYLEDIILEVIPPHPEGVFHPKIWVLRFKGSGGNRTLYRFLCLSKNLTFDRSWDTVLMLEGIVGESIISRNQPLSDFIKFLPSIAVKELNQKPADKLQTMAGEILKVEFELPDHVEEMRFHPIGIPEAAQPVFDGGDGDRLIISPFLRAGMLEKLFKAGRKNILISRQEELDLIPRELLKKYTRIYLLNEIAGEEEESPLEISSEVKKEADMDEGRKLSGLHAKLYLEERGWDAHVWTGSANASPAAFYRNVECLVELRGKKSRLGITPLLKQEEGNTTFYDLLDEYKILDEPAAEDSEKKNLEEMLRKIERELIRQEIKATVYSGDEKDFFDMEVSFADSLKLDLPQKPECMIRPISLRSYSGLEVDLFSPERSVFQRIELEKLTSLMVFKITYGSVENEFVLNLPVDGMPGDRRERILQRIVEDKDNFIRYLLLLLFEGDYAFWKGEMGKKGSGGDINWKRFFGDSLPLFEELVRAYSRAPEKIERIAQLLRELDKTEGGREALPAEFHALWAMLEEAMAT